MSLFIALHWRVEASSALAYESSSGTQAGCFVGASHENPVGAELNQAELGFALLFLSLSLSLSPLNLETSSRAVYNSVP